MGRHAWASDDPDWGIWSVPERDVRALPPVDGRDVVELGCGTAYWSAWLARRGARVVGLDNSSKQLATARTLQQEHTLVFPLVHADAEHAPFRDQSFDLAISEYGAAIWCDPYRWIPEAARLLRPGGELVFLRNSILFSLCAPDAEEPAGDRLLRDYFGLHRLEWTDDGAVNFSLGVGPIIRLFRENGFEILDCIELQAPSGTPVAVGGNLARAPGAALSSVGEAPMSYAIVKFPEPREVFIDDQAQGSNLSATGRPRILFVNAGIHTFRLGGNDSDPASQQVDVAECPILDPFVGEFKKC
jgi:SAM-dependent methyltransferase